MIKLAYRPTDEALAKRILGDLKASGYDAETLKASDKLQATDLLIPIFSAPETADSALQETLFNGLDLSLHIVPVLHGTPIPSIIDHLDHVDFAKQYEFDELKTLIDAALDKNAPLPLKVLTPKTRRSNLMVGFWVALFCLTIFLISLYAVGVLKIQRPNDEYDAVETQFVQTRDAIMEPQLATLEALLPTNPEEAYVYPATLFSVPTRIRPFVEQTATMYGINSNIIPATVTPTAGQ